jgi:hypothetical protein
MFGQFWVAFGRFFSPKHLVTLLQSQMKATCPVVCQAQSRPNPGPIQAQSYSDRFVLTKEVSILNGIL